MELLAAKMSCFIVVELRKNSTKLMNYLGGIGPYDGGEVEWLFRPILWVNLNMCTCERPPRV